MVIGQTFCNFDFLVTSQEFGRFRKSAFISTGLLLLIIVNETAWMAFGKNTFLIIANLTTALLLILFVFKNEHLNEQAKLIELSFLTVTTTALTIVDLKVLLGLSFSLYTFGVIALFVLAATLSLNTYSLEYEIQNINKWPTSDIKIRYTDSLRLYLDRREEFLFLANIHGYMEIHRHKCEFSDCPSRETLTANEQKFVEGDPSK